MTAVKKRSDTVWLPSATMGTAPTVQPPKMLVSVLLLMCAIPSGRLQNHEHHTTPNKLTRVLRSTRTAMASHAGVP